MDSTRFKKTPILAIVRGAPADTVEPLCDAVGTAGVYALEFTMNTHGAEEMIRNAVAYTKGKLAIGAGTVVSEADLECALAAGATFIVMPVFIADIVAACVRRKIPVFPGGLTPQEVFTAWRAGATMVKVFPAGTLGPEYLRELKGPFNDMELLACSGVRPDTVKQYLSCGASAIAVGASVFRPDLLMNKSFHTITEKLREYVKELPR